MLLQLLLITITILTGWAYLRWRRVRSYWADRGVPHNPPHPILGSLTFLFGKNPGVWFREVYMQFYKSPYVGMWLFWRPTLVINDPEVAKRILVKDSEVWRDRLLSSGNSDPIGGLNIFTLNDPMWSWIRRKISPVFTSSKLRSLQPLLQTKAEELIQRIRNETKQGKKINIREVYTDYTTDLIGITSFGVESSATLTGEGPMRSVTREFQKYSVGRAISFISIFFFPALTDFIRATFFPKEAAAFLKKIFLKVVEQRGGWGAELKNNDLVDCLIKAKQDSGKDKMDASDDLLAAQAAVMVQAGFETSSTLLTFVSYELAHQPELQERLYAELTDLKEKHQELDTTVLMNAPYLNAVLKEGLRKYPPMGWLDRICSKDYKIDDKLTLKADTNVYINAIGLHWDPEYFPEPENFNPDRFLPENEANIKPFTFMPFGEGPRVCIGRRFAELTSRAALSQLILNFRIELLPNAKHPNKVEFGKKGLFLMPGEILNLHYVSRG